MSIRADFLPIIAFSPSHGDKLFSGLDCLLALRLVAQVAQPAVSQAASLLHSDAKSICRLAVSNPAGWQRAFRRGPRLGQRILSQEQCVVGDDL